MHDLHLLSDDKQLAGSLKMIRNTSASKHVTFVLVEGESDRTFFSSLLEGAKIVRCDGWLKLLETIKEADRIGLEGIIGIIDADLGRILPDRFQVPPTNVFRTDGHDLEMMLLHSPAFEKVLQEYSPSEPRASSDKLGSAETTSKLKKFEANTGKPILNTLLEAAKPLGVLRLVNAELDLRLQFKKQKQKEKGFDFLEKSKFIRLENLSCNCEDLLTAVENFNIKPRYFRDSGKSTKERFEARLREDFDLAELCNGHVVVRILALALERAIGNIKSNNRADLSEQLERNFRLAYHPQHFAQTRLYHELKAWPVPEGFRLEILP
jgi:hypothetical protein